MISASGAVWASASRSAPALKPCEIVLAHELEALAERAAMLLDRPPERGIGRVVDDDDALEVRIVEPRHRIERRLEHLRRLDVGRDVDRDLRRERRFGRERRRRDQPARLAAERDRGDLLDPRQRDQDQRHQQQQAEREGEGRAGHEVVAVPDRRTRSRTSRRPRAPRRRAARPGRRSRRPAPGSAATAARRSAPRCRRASSGRDW